MIDWKFLAGNWALPNVVITSAVAHKKALMFRQDFPVALHEIRDRMRTRSLMRAINSNGISTSSPSPSSSSKRSWSRPGSFSIRISIDAASVTRGRSSLSTTQTLASGSHVARTTMALPILGFPDFWWRCVIEANHLNSLLPRLRITSAQPLSRFSGQIK
jgi:hypothetical protein